MLNDIFLTLKSPENYSRSVLYNLFPSGAVNIDVVAETFEARTESGIDLIKGSVYHAMGGVGRNIAECMLKQGQKSTLVR